MRAAPILVLLLARCGGDSVTDRIDALRRDEACPQGGLLPGAESGPKLAARMREDANGKALLEAGDAAVPELARLLGDPQRQKVAAAFLAEIGGKEAARALLDEWRELRGQAKRKCIFRLPDLTRSLGSRYENIDAEFYGELLDALGYAGRPVSADLARDTEAALAECERLAGAADEVLRETREEDGRMLELRSRPEPVETAREGLSLLARTGAPEAPALLGRALDLPILRKTALRNLVHLGERAGLLVPRVARLLDDPLWHDEAQESLTDLADSLTEEQRVALVRRLGGQASSAGLPPH